jgi:hypothetical protein
MSKPETKPTLNIVETTPAEVLKQLAAHMTANPFATDRQTVMVGAKGRELQTALQRATTLRAEADAIEKSLNGLCAEAINILNGTHPGLSAGGGKGK